MPILFLTAAAGGWIATGLARAAAVRWRLVAPPNPVIPDRQAPVPYLGGLGILAGAMAALLVHAWRSGGGWTVPWGLAVGCAGFALVGLIDDWSALAPGLKFLAQLAAASAAVWAGIPGGPPIHAGAFPDAVFRVLWIVTVVNAVNFIDVSDALAATVALVTCFLWGVVPGCSPFPEAMTAAAGGCAGFLFWNRPPARIYMGDCGSHWLGFVMAAAALAAPVAPRSWPGLVLLPMWTAVPVFELLFISTVRLHKGLPWWKGSPDHFALRLRKAGMSKAGIAVLSAFFTAAGWFGARCAATAGVWVRACLISAALATGCVCWKLLLPWDVVPEAGEDRR